jgi:hypothetical protein
MPQPRSRPKVEILAAAALALSACNSKPADVVGGNVPDGPLATDNEVRSPAEAAAAGEAGELPPPSAAPRFVGKWAVDQQSCTAAVWQFTMSTLRTPSGESCTFDRVNDLAGGYRIDATCKGRGEPRSETIDIAFAESAKAMLLQSKSLGDKGLVFCGRDA